MLVASNLSLAALGIGHLMQNTVPWLGRTRMESWPPLDVTSSCTMRWPNPRLAWLGMGRGWRKAAATAGGTPGPLSSMVS
jgi:hypothetical protein